MPGRRALQAVDGLADPVSGACNIGRLAQTRAFRSGLSDPPRMSVWRLLASSDPGARLALPVLANVRARAPRQREPCSSVDALLVQSQMGAAPDGALSTLARPHQEWALSRPALPQHLDERGTTARTAMLGGYDLSPAGDPNPRPPARRLPRPIGLGLRRQVHAPQVLRFRRAAGTRQPVRPVRSASRASGWVRITPKFVV